MKEEKISDVDYDLGGATQPAHSRLNWPFVVNALIRRFLAEDVLRSAHNAVERAVQTTGEDEGSFTKSLSKKARL